MSKPIKGEVIMKGYLLRATDKDGKLIYVGANGASYDLGYPVPWKKLPDRGLVGRVIVKAAVVVLEEETKPEAEQ